MKHITAVLKKFAYYRDVKHLWMLFSNGKYRHVNRFLYYRLWVNRKLQRSGRVLEQPMNTTEYTLHMLCGHNDLSQLIWALASWYKASAESPQVFIHNDGTLTQRDQQGIQTFFPSCKIVDCQTTTNEASTWLAQYPLARQIRTLPHPTSPHRIANPLAIKMIDPYFISPAEHVLILDTDILWFRKPEELIRSIYQYTRPVFWADARTAPFVFQTGERLRDDLAYYNSGVVYYRKQEMNFSMLEEYLGKRGSDFHDPWFGFNDQPALAYMFGQYGHAILLPPERYICKGAISETTVAAHYLGPIRPMFWVKGIEYVQQKHAIC